MGDMGVKINIPSCFVKRYILDGMILKGVLETPRMEFLKENDSDVKSCPQEFNEVSVSEVNLEQKGLERLSEIELAQKGIILVKNWRVANDMTFFPKTRREIEIPEGFTWIKIEKITVSPDG